MRKKAKARPPFPWRPLFLFILGVNGAVGLMKSRITAASHVEIEGAPMYDQPRLRQIVSLVNAKPFFAVDGRAIETEAMRNPAVRTARFGHSLLGSASLQVYYRDPVARMLGRPGMALDGDGVIFPDPDMPPALVGLSLPDAGPPTLATIAGNWDAKRLAELSRDVLEFADPGQIEIQVDTRGAVYLAIRGGKVVIGSCNDLQKKLDVLRNRLRANPTELAEIEELNLVHPDIPAIVQKRPMSRAEATKKIGARRTSRRRNRQNPLTEERNGEDAGGQD